MLNRQKRAQSTCGRDTGLCSTFYSYGGRLSIVAYRAEMTNTAVFTGTLAATFAASILCASLRQLTHAGVGRRGVYYPARATSSPELCFTAVREMCCRRCFLHFTSRCAPRNPLCLASRFLCVIWYDKRRNSLRGRANFRVSALVFGASLLRTLVFFGVASR